MPEIAPALALSISHLTKQFDAIHGVRNISLDVTTGEVFGFLGPNGAGKSTTINTVLDLLKPDSGTITVLGLDHHDRALAVRRRLGYLSGDMMTDPTLTGEQYLRFVAHLRGHIERATIDKLVSRLRVDTTTKIKHLSRGNRQKIGLVAALMHDPDILILDEPTSGLDPLMQAEFNAIIHEHRDRGKTTFISSHVLSEVQSICDRVGFIRDGTLIHVGTLESLRAHAGQRVTMSFVATPPLAALKSIKDAHDIQVNGQRVTFSYNGDINELLRFMASRKVDAVEITEPELESLFMKYYQSEKKT